MHWEAAIPACDSAPELLLPQASMLLLCPRMSFSVLFCFGFAAQNGDLKALGTRE